MDPAGWIDNSYTLPRKAKLMAWHSAIVELYENPENAENDVPRLILLAGKSLEKKYGPEAARDTTGGFKRLGAAIQAMKRAGREQNKAENATEEAGDDAAKAESVDSKKDADQANAEEPAEDSADDSNSDDDPKPAE
jgi:hypothetical protein